MICDRHGGEWGDDETCPNCTTITGEVREVLQFIKGETTVHLTGTDSNVFMLTAQCTKAMKRAGATAEQVKEFTDEIFDSSDYHSALAIMIEWFDIA